MTGMADGAAEARRLLQALGPGGLCLSAADDRDRAATWRPVAWTLTPATRAGALARALAMLEPGEALHVRPHCRREDAPDARRVGQVCLDLDAVPVDRLRALGVEPAAVVETSPGRWQAWVRFPEPVPPEAAGRFAAGAVRALGLEPGAKGWSHAGRLPGFVNGKHGSRVRLIEASGRAADRAALDAVARQAPRPAPARWGPPRPPGTRTMTVADLPRTVEDFHRDRKYVDPRDPQQERIDLNRADMGYARYALSRGVPPEAVEAAIQAAVQADPERRRRKDRGYARRTVQNVLQKAAPPRWAPDWER